MFIAIDNESSFYEKQTIKNIDVKNIFKIFISDVLIVLSTFTDFCLMKR